MIAARVARSATKRGLGCISRHNRSSREDGGDCLEAASKVDGGRLLLHETKRASGHSMWSPAEDLEWHPHWANERWLGISWAKGDRLGRPLRRMMDGRVCDTKGL